MVFKKFWSSSVLIVNGLTKDCFVGLKKKKSLILKDPFARTAHRIIAESTVACQSSLTQMI